MKKYSNQIFLLCVLLLFNMACKTDNSSTSSEPTTKIKDPKKEVQAAPQIDAASGVEGSPNIILFMVDDMGWQDASIPFGKEKATIKSKYETPNLEKLSAEGVRFLEAYGYSEGASSRISMMTGMNALRHRVTNEITNNPNAVLSKSSNSNLRFPKWNANGLTSDSTTTQAVYATSIAFLLRHYGYQTIHVGKANFGAKGTPGADPKRLGFNINIGGSSAEAPKSYLGSENFGNTSSDELPGLEKYYGKDVSLPEALTLEALNLMDEAVKSGKPFFLNLAHYAASDASMVAKIDKSLGDVLNHLDQKEIAKNTVVIFVSDNGGTDVSSKGKLFKGGQGSIYEGGIRVPLIVKWPGITQPNTTIRNYVLMEDLYPSLANIAGQNTRNVVQKVDGRSFIKLLRTGANTTQQIRPLYWHNPMDSKRTGNGGKAHTAVRKGDWKLIYFHENQTRELYNLRKDMGEQNELSTKHATELNDLSMLLKGQLKFTKAPLPFLKKTGKVIPYPKVILSEDQKNALRNHKVIKRK